MLWKKCVFNHFKCHNEEKKTNFEIQKKVRNLNFEKKTETLEQETDVKIFSFV
jgi:hypothetical protein